MDAQVISTEGKRLPLERATLDELAVHNHTTLATLYKQGLVPHSVAVLDGHPQGRVLAVRGVDAPLMQRWVKQLAHIPSFPWAGKSFASRNAHTGLGINRVHLLGRHNLFPFQTSIGPSRYDERAAVILNYDIRDNPAPVRRVHAELREVAPGLFLGPEMWKTQRGPRLVLWFAVDTNKQSEPVTSLAAVKAS